MNQEGDLVSTDLDNQSLTQHTLNRYAGASDPSQSLYGYIRTSHGVNLADPESLPRVLRPHDQRDLIEDESSISNLDTDEGVLVQVDFSELVRVKTILLSTPPSGEERPAACKVWVNRADGVTLDQVDDLKPDQEFELLPERGAVEYATRLSRFSNVSSLVLYLALSRRSDQLRCYYIGFKGNSRIHKRDESQHMMQAAETGMPAPVDGLKQTQGAAQRLAR